MSVIVAAGVKAAESGVLPDAVLVAGIRRMLEARLRSLDTVGPPVEPPVNVPRARDAPGRAVAVEVDAANEQHYEVPPDFFELVLGPALKYSSAWWSPAETDLDRAEAAMLERTLERARVEDGMDVLDLGCGWGSFTLTAAGRRPNSRFTAVSNSSAQIAYIRRRAHGLGLSNVVARLADINDYAPDGAFDRIVTVEMLEHVRDHATLLRDLATWVRPGGSLFVHVFCHERHEYPFETTGAGNWMGRHFFTGGMMPSRRTIPQAAERSRGWSLAEEWRIDGTHYARTAEAWLENLDANFAQAVQALGNGSSDPEKAARRWRMFFLAVRETFGFRGGREWGVGHYRFERSPA